MRTGAELSAEQFVARLLEMRSEIELEKILRYFKTEPGEYAAGDEFVGVRMGDVFHLARDFTWLSLPGVETLLESPTHEVRAGACKVMALRAKHSRATVGDREQLFDLYLRRHDRIDNWDLVDLVARDVVGSWLFDKSRRPIYELAKSDVLWERRTAITATHYFINHQQLDDTYAIAEILLDDREDLIHKAVGGFLREAGKHDLPRLRRFLNEHAAAMPRTMLRYATQKLPKGERERLRSKAQKQ